MATSQGGFGRLLDEYGGPETVVPTAIVLFAGASAVLFGIIEPITVIITETNFVFDSQHAFLVSLGALAAVYATSETRAWDHYYMAEKAVVGGAVAAMVANEMGYTLFIDTVSNYDPLASMALFGLSIVAGVIMAR